MKKLSFLMLLMVLSVAYVFGAAISRIAPTSVSLFNFSNYNYDVTDHKLSIDGNFYDVNNLTISSGSLNTTAGSTLSFSGLSLSASYGSVGLWAPGTNTASPLASDMVSFAQWGATGQAFESLAIAAYLWAANNKIIGNMPFKRTSYNNTGADEWEEETPSAIPSTLLQHGIQVGPNPFLSEMIVRADLRGENNNCQLYDMTGKLLIDRRMTNGGLIIATETLAKGMYIMQITSANGDVMVTRKMLKQ